VSKCGEHLSARVLGPCGSSITRTSRIKRNGTQRGKNDVHLEATRALNFHEEGVRRHHKALELVGLCLEVSGGVEEIVVKHLDIVFERVV